ncbi:MAG: glycerophosphodiester phosphodiesterase family protein [Planctomycetales bacterium]|nr:glycerophosphodiester phosphodiesterase family protein [Planctomycetales bacterium]
MVKRVVVIAHRTAHREHPENSLAGIAAAAEMGCDYVELDVRQTSDGALVLMHDSSVDRVTNGHGKVADLTLAEIKALRLNHRGDGDTAAQRIPTFDEALAALGDHLQLYLDHKEAPEDMVVGMLGRHDMIARTAVYSSPEELARFRALTDGLRLMTPHPDDEAQMRAWREGFHADVFDGGGDEWTAASVAAAHQLGVQVWVDCLGGEDNVEGWRHAVEIGVDGIQSDRPAELIAFLEGMGRR